jgi:c(7)-type cytochrome triheme protein
VPFAVPGYIYPAEPGIRCIGRALLTLLLLFFVHGIGAQGYWESLSKDGLHDPKNPAIKDLQEPRAALSQLPPDTTGNMVRWIEAKQKGIIKPLPSLKGAQAKILDKDILLNLNGGMPIVLFPHQRHTEWLDCSNCHDSLFKTKTGTSGISMFQILRGEQCGVCHGAVSFPLTECNRCHSVLRSTLSKDHAQVPNRPLEPALNPP